MAIGSRDFVPIYCIVNGQDIYSKNVVSKNMLDKYIRNKFNYFYNKYKTVVYITEEDKNVWILLFSIMIFENYNRGGIKRKFERIKIFFGRSATVGIMQVIER